jgi:hypothetical protein
MKKVNLLNCSTVWTTVRIEFDWISDMKCIPSVEYIQPMVT